MHTINLAHKLSQIHEQWSPRIIAELNGQHMKLAKLHGAFVWHKHDEADELFLVLSGHLVIELRDGVMEIGPGECAVIPRGVEHRPVADEEVHVLLVEPAGTVNTGDVESEHTVPDPEWL